jgi:hypothetical protein
MERKGETSRVSKDIMLTARTADRDGGGAESWLGNEAWAKRVLRRPRDSEPTLLALIAVGQPQAVTRQRVGGPSESTRLSPPAALS